MSGICLRETRLEAACWSSWVFGASGCSSGEKEGRLGSETQEGSEDPTQDWPQDGGDKHPLQFTCINPWAHTTISMHMHTYMPKHEYTEHICIPHTYKFTTYGCTQKYPGNELEPRQKYPGNELEPRHSKDSAGFARSQQTQV